VYPLAAGVTCRHPACLLGKQAGTSRGFIQRIDKDCGGEKSVEFCDWNCSIR
jgi:hypothetical protein